MGSGRRQPLRIAGNGILEGSVRIAIIGSGPAGLSAAAHAAEENIDHILLEKTDHLSDTIVRYQRGKHIMATPNQLKLRAGCEFAAGSRESIIDVWNTQAKSKNVNIRYGAEATAISGTKGSFKIQLANGDMVEATHVILSIGVQGNPNRLRCEGADLPQVQYQLDDPGAYIDEHVFVVGAGDAGIENALGLVADPAQNNIVTLLNSRADYPTAKGANVKALLNARDEGRISILENASTTRIEPDTIVVETADGPVRLECDRLIARIGAAPPRKLVESFGVRFTSDARDAFPQLSPTFESSVSGLYVVGALAGYPLIKHCMNQGYDVVEYISGNVGLKPADEPILEEKITNLPGGGQVSDWIERLRSNVEILRGVSPLQMREFLIDCDVRFYRSGEALFLRNAIGSSLFGLVEGDVAVEIDPADPKRVERIPQGSIVGEVGLISGRRRGATVRASGDCIAIEIPRNATLKLMAQVQAARDAINRIVTERQILQIFRSGLAASDIAELVATEKTFEAKANDVVVQEGEESSDVYIVRRGSMVTEKMLGGKPVYLSYIPAGSYFGEMALLGNGRRTATVRAAIKSQLTRLDGAAFRRTLTKHPVLLRKLQDDMAGRLRVDGFVDSRAKTARSIVDLHTGVAKFLVEQGIGEATDVLIIDEKLCIGCDNCERACADAHDGLSRLDREAGRSYANIHVPTSCRHCEHPYCMTDCPPNAIHRGADGEVFIENTCIGCGNCQRYCPYGVIRMEHEPPKKPGLLSWLLWGAGPGPGEPDAAWSKAHSNGDARKTAVKCDMCAGIRGGPACVRACPTGAALRVSPEDFLSVSRLEQELD
jgi:cGMP-dependent protein kinase 2